MVFDDLRDFLAFLDEKGELKRIDSQVDPELEITEITDRVSKAYGPALYFSNAKGSKIPVLINVFGSYERMSWALGVEKLDEVAEKLTSLVPEDFPGSLREKIAMLFRLKEVASLKPKTVSSAPCQEVVRRAGEFSLAELPVLKCWPGDGGRFITLPLVVTKNPDTGRQNIGMYRLQVFDETTTGMHWHTHHDGAANFRRAVEKGEKFEVAVALGGDPATIYSATAPLPSGVDELLFAGFLRGKPVEVVKAKTVDLLVPAKAEIVLEGYVSPETRLEGPFGDHTGYYSLAGQYPTFHVTAMTHRADPVYPTTIVGKPPMEDCYMAKATERIFLPAIKATMPEIVDLNLPLEGVFHNCALISIKKEYPGQAFKVANSVWGLGQMMFTKFVVVVDADVDVQNTSEVAWKVFNNVSPERDLLLSKGPLDALDHSSNLPDFGAKMAIDATKKWPEEGHTREWPDDIVMSDDVKEKVTKKWREYGF
ncbi:MAG: menaquinone biosynthesis decarboxylase [Actinobacteria bacterium]|nr:MAG: menaquinone biosynthesis decarboxylase [Actinomycetota bacterium]